MKKLCIICTFVLLVLVVCGCKMSNEIIIPKEYADLINNDYLEFAKNISKEDFENYINNHVPVEWFDMAVDARHGLEDVNISSFGYSLKDINNDGVVELILLRDDYFLLAIYTLNLDKPKCLDTFSYKHKGTVLSTGEIYTVSSGGWNYISHKIESLDNYTGLLVAVQEFGCDGANGYYVQEHGKERKRIDEIEYNSLAEKYPMLGTISNKEYLIKNNISFKSISTS